MTNRTYTDLIELIRALAGVDEFAPTEATKLLAMANRRLRQAYDACDVWPRYMRLDARPAPNGYVPYSYDANAGARMASTVTRDGTAVTFTTGGVDFDVVPGQNVTISGLTGSENPNGVFQVSAVSGQTLTYLLPEGTGTETYSGTGLCTPVAIPDVEIFMRLHDRNPVKTPRAAWETDFYVDYNGANPIDSGYARDSYWVTYKAVWDGPYTNASATIPQEWFFFAAHATYADFLRMDGQVDKALAEEATAQVYLEAELSKTSQQRNVVNLFRRFTTYTSRQNR
jgi:hypothetical protein